MKCKVCCNVLTHKEQIFASANDNPICESCWVIEYNKRINKETYLDNLSRIPKIYQTDKKIFEALFSMFGINKSNATTSNVIMHGKSGSNKTLSAYGYLKEVWGLGYIGRLIPYADAIANVSTIKKYEGYLIIDDVVVTPDNSLLLEIIDYRLNNDLYTFIITTAFSLKDFGEKIDGRFSRYYVNIKTS